MAKPKSSLKKIKLGYLLPAFLGFAGLIFVIYWFAARVNQPAQTAQNIQPVASASAADIHADCESRTVPSEKFDCYAANFTSYMKANGGKKTLELLDSLKGLGGYAHANCHPLSHKVGNIALHQYGSVPAAVPEYLPVCASGYYHGLLEEYLATAESYEKGVVEVCGTTDSQPYFNWFQCTHGLGHGVMQFRDNEVPIALKDCDLLDPANQAREICYAGVFMENITTDEKTGHQAKYIKLDDPLYPCNFVADQYRSACYFLASSQIMKLNNWNFPETFKTCATTEQKYRYLCFQSLGRDVSGSSLQDKVKIKQLCGLTNVYADKADCYFGAVRDVVNDEGKFDKAIATCNYLESDFTQRCYDGILFDLGLFKSGSEYEAVCATMPEPFRSQCIGLKKG